ncbi:hypothetical protein EMCG_05025 [[Emmonsia] crescens]|uniref:Protein kinase domain-containing protein n=1 Tax=[Emmonsia] crescens TaxID=73230 RepID=A0A0G2HR94_9EURO|nr:hypothetical protein EMCG_05025 [Emmonsia crescens UAMH 3008]
MVLNEQKLPLRLIRADILGSGSASIVFAIGERIALKAPIIYKANIQLTDQQIEQSTDSIASLAREKEGIFMPQMSCTVHYWMQDDPESIPAPLRLRWVKELASAAEHLEIHGLVHGGIRPTNTLLDNNMHIRLADFDSCVSSGEDCLAFTVPYHDAFEERASHTTEQFAIGSFMYAVFTGVEPEF